MNWWKKAIIGSVIWTVLIVVGVTFQLQRIKREAISPATVMLGRPSWERLQAIFLCLDTWLFGVFSGADTVAELHRHELIDA
jgi:hypothetical protein